MKPSILLVTLRRVLLIGVTFFTAPGGNNAAATVAAVLKRPDADCNAAGRLLAGQSENYYFMKKIFQGIGLAAVVLTACHKNDNGSGTNVNVLNSTDSVFIMKATQGNLAEVAAGNIADSFAFRDSVKMFGSMMVGDHTTAQKSLDSIGGKWNIDLPNAPDSAHVAMAAMLRTLSGNTFDSTYLAGQIADHKNTETLYQDEIQNGNNTQVLTYAKRVLPIVEMHLMMADSLASH